MHQKYTICRDGTQKKLKIREYAIIEKKPKKVAYSAPTTGRYTLLCEETYESDVIVSTLAQGVNAMVAILRTHNIFPVERNATKIAESVMALYKSSEDGPVELFFDDLDYLTV